MGSAGQTFDASQHKGDQDSPQEHLRAHAVEEKGGAPKDREAEGKKGPGFFQINLDRFASIPQHDIEAEVGHEIMGYREMAAYLVQCGGVNGNLPLPRASTHGAESVAARTSVSYRSASDSLQRLLKAGFLTTPPADFAGVRKGPGSVYWQVDPELPAEAALSQDLLQRRRQDSGEYPLETLGYLLDHIEIHDCISRPMAALDALALFCALHRNQDFDAYAGVDPNRARARCPLITRGEDGDGTDGIVPLAGHEGWSLVTVRCPPALGFTPAFVQEVMEPLPAWSDAPSLEERFAHAHRQLQRAGLVYNVCVIWQGQPLGGEARMRPEVLATLYVGSRRDRNLEHRLQDTVHEMILATGTQSGIEVFGESRGCTPRWSNSGLYRYLVPTSSVRTTNVLLQCRARRWAHDRRTIEALEIDSRRVKQWRTELQSLKCAA